MLVLLCQKNLHVPNMTVVNSEMLFSGNIPSHTRNSQQFRYFPGKYGWHRTTRLNTGYSTWYL